jgi:5-methylcytosine-specific restriction endonuclease McrA
MTNAAHKQAAYNSAEYKVNRRAVLDRAGWRCEWPGCTNPANTADHITPLDQGGTNALDNLRASCKACNSRGGQLLSRDARAKHRVGHRSRRW